MKQLSIIVPVYNVEKYVRTCVESLYRQGMDEKNFEVIIVNDGTPDKSMDIIAEIAQHHTNIIVVNQENQGLPAARNTGMLHSTGEYILYIDSDDLLYDNTLQYVINLGQQQHADLVIADFKKVEDREIEKRQRHTIQQEKGHFEVKTGKELLLEDLIPDECYCWRALYRKEFLDKKNIRFVPGINYEDIPFTHECYIKADICVKVYWLFYIYRKGQSSISSSLTLKKGKELCLSIAEAWKLTKTDGLDPIVKQRLKDDVFASFSALIYGVVHEMRNAGERREIVAFVKLTIPDLTFTNGIKQRFVNFMYQHMPNTYLSSRVLYGRYIEKTIRKWRRTIS